MQMVLAFPDLRAAGIVQSRTTLNKMIDERGFPPGRIVANRRIWTSVEILDWLHAQPSEKLALKGYATPPASRRLPCCRRKSSPRPCLPM